jgi:hypothetical protein
MANQKCEHDPCSCSVDAGKSYCSDACRDLAQAASQAQGRCGCDHKECAAHHSAPA